MEIRNRVLAYWRFCLTDSLRVSMDTKKSKHITFSMSEFNEGKITYDTYLKALKELKVMEGSDIECILAPIILKPKRSYYNEQQFVYPMLIPVKISGDLTIYFDSTQQPWIPRNILEPQNSSFVRTFGTVFDYESFLAEKGLLEPNSWNDLIRYIKELEAAVLHYTEHEFIIGKECCLFLEPKGNDYAIKTILNFYNQLEKDKPNVPLLDAYVELSENKQKNIELDEFELSKGHLGQMSDEYPLSPSQRETLHKFMTNRDGEILAVNGPPGTGKTTLLQSVVATKLVESVIVNAESPPIIVASSTNNQAVTNIIDSFGKTAETADDPDKKYLVGRWINEIESYGLYCPSKSRFEKELKEDSKFHMKSPDGEGFIKEYNKISLVEQERIFLKHFADYSGMNNLSIEEAAQWLKKKVLETVDNLTNVIDLDKKISLLEKELKSNIENNGGNILKQLIAIFSVLKKAAIGFKLSHYKKKFYKNHKYVSTFGSRKEKSILEHLDSYQRYIAFKLSVHYWEAMYLINKKKQTKEADKPIHLLDEWKDSAQLFPCHVSTLYTLPKLFGKWKGSMVEPLYNAIDLLIIDEAGQVSPEIGGPAFALAKSALVVGDEVQIEPVWNLPVSIDQMNMIRSDLAKKETIVKDYHQLKRIGIATTGTSLIKTAQKASQFQMMDGIRGMFLSEHRRCQNEIISYCNDLAYHGKLSPMTEYKNDFHFLPRIGYAHVHGMETKQGGSRCNKNEAYVIAEWIKKNEDRLTTASKKTLEDTIAVITPFTLQKKVIKEALGEKYKNITVGTVHALQGSEREVIIFSSVYSSDSSYFFDMGVNMLNVALSRAKQSFLVFGNMDIFKLEGDKPSNLLARYLFSSEENELIDLPVIKRNEIQDEIEHLNTHEAHDALLCDVLQKAKRSVSITSPFIRYAASEKFLLQSIKNAVSRGIEVNIYANTNFNFLDGIPIKSAESPINDLMLTKAKVTFLPNIHNKTLWMDDSVLVEGSFNWLSAIRKKDHKFHNYESSIVYRGEKTSTLINEIERELFDKIQNKN